MSNYIPKYFGFVFVNICHYYLLSYYPNTYCEETIKLQESGPEEFRKNSNNVGDFINNKFK